MLALAAFGYMAGTVEMQYSVDNTITGSAIVDWGGLTSDGLYKEPDYAIGTTFGRLQNTSFGALWYSTPTEGYIGDWGARFELRRGIAYLKEPDKAAIVIEPHFDIYWRWIQLGIAVTSMTYVDRTLKLPAKLRFTLGVRKALTRQS